MPTINDLKKSKFLKKEDFPKPALLTIRGYEEANVAMEGTEPEMRWALTFNEVEKPWIVNSTCGQIIVSKHSGSLYVFKFTHSHFAPDVSGQQFVIFHMQSLPLLHFF